ncbi:M14 family metallopeptidase [Bacillus alkalisoli]|uniref:M14 family metallopeptidase n=1 Tax=Bacillus alkalisoli TaxID=2011008 RepID=UPI000C24F19D|nr:M14 family metallopeptidase [Bacillus alkalisoli]
MKVKVRKGDTFWYYSKLFKLPLQLILDANSQMNPDNLQIGAEISIPGYEAVHVSKHKLETIQSFSQKTQLPLDSLQLLNQSSPNLTDVTSLSMPRRLIGNEINIVQKMNSANLAKHIQYLGKMFPFVKVETIGHSVLGKPIQHLQIGRGKKKVHFNGSFHANEWITTVVIMKFLNDYLHSLTNATMVRSLYMSPFYDEVTLSIVPMVNPDGVDLVLNGLPKETEYSQNVQRINKGLDEFTAWKANIRGVDLNNQYPANWEIEKERKIPKTPAPRDYPGDAPLTEPEAQAMAELAHKENFDRVLAFHTQGEEFYWGYEGFEPNVSSNLAKEFESVSSYKAVQYVDSHAGYKDWFIKEFKKPGFTLELGKGINPLPLSHFPSVYKKTLGIMLAALYM